MNYSRGLACALACYFYWVDRSGARLRTTKNRACECTDCLETSEDALRNQDCDFVFSYAAIKKNDALLPTLRFWLNGNEPIVMYSQSLAPFFCPRWLLVDVARHRKLMWLRNGAHFAKELCLSTNNQIKNAKLHSNALSLLVHCIQDVIANRSLQ